MSHRIREAMKAPGGFNTGGGTIEVTYVGGKERTKHASKRDVKNIGGMGKQIIFSRSTAPCALVPHSFRPRG